MKILILGSEGMLGNYLTNHLKKESFKSNNNSLIVIPSSRNHNKFYCDFKKLDSIDKVLSEVRPDLVINCAAITSLEYCETNKEECIKVNGYSPGYIAELCKLLSIRFIHISTDHFYKNDGPRAHTEEDKTHILNTYAESKLIAEQEIIKKGKDFLILRTSMVGLTKENRSYLDWIIHNLRKGKEVSLFFNSYTSLIHCHQLSKIIFNLCSLKLKGIYNISCNEVFSKGELYIGVAKKLKIKPVFRRDEPNSKIILRSNSCGLSSKKIESTTGLAMPSFEDVLDCIFLEQEGLKIVD